MINKIKKLIENSNLLVPTILFNNYKLLNISNEELILLIYFINFKTPYNPSLIAKQINWTLEEVLTVTSTLSSKGILKISSIKDNNNRLEEIINLEDLYTKLAHTIVNEEIIIKEEVNLFDVFEKEFGRTLSGMEYELINAWKKNDFDDELIILALKEAVFNGAPSLRYIDKIIYEWRKKGIKNENDVNKEKENFMKEKKKDIPEIIEYDWLNDKKD